MMVTSAANRFGFAITFRRTEMASLLLLWDGVIFLCPLWCRGLCRQQCFQNGRGVLPHRFLQGRDWCKESSACFQTESLMVVFVGELFHWKCGSKDSPGCNRCQVNHVEEHRHRPSFCLPISSKRVYHLVLVVQISGLMLSCEISALCWGVSHSVFCCLDNYVSESISGLKRKGILLKTQR